MCCCFPFSAAFHLVFMKLILSLGTSEQLLISGPIIVLKTLRLCSDNKVLFVRPVVVAMVAFGRWHWDVSGQVFVIFILTVAAAEAALALALVVRPATRSRTSAAIAWTTTNTLVTTCLTKGPVVTRAFQKSSGFAASRH